jgi:hypothetical protein
VAGWLQGETLHGTLWRAGLPKTMRPAAVTAGSDLFIFFSGTLHAKHTRLHAANAPAQLAGLRVVEFTHMVMGPTCGMVLADMGAEVIKVEPADGDRTRHLLGAGSGFFPLFNRNKKSIGINLHDEAGAAVARKLCASADVVIENFKPGTMAKYGLDYTALSASQPTPHLRQPQGLFARPV